VLATLLKIRRHDPEVFQPDVKFFGDEEDAQEKGGGEEEGAEGKPRRKEKPMFLRTVLAQQVRAPAQRGACALGCWSAGALERWVACGILHVAEALPLAAARCGNVCVECDRVGAAPKCAKGGTGLISRSRTAPPAGAGGRP
jgi:hypothetical protein